MNRILIVDDELNMRLVLQAMLKKEGYIVAAASDGLEALKMLKTTGPLDVVVTDLKMPNLDGMGLLDRMIRDYPSTPVIIITAHGTVATAVDALKKGAFDYISKPFEQEDLKNVIEKAIQTRRLNEDEMLLDPDDIDRYGIIGAGPVMADVFETVRRVAPTTTTVLITGETGTGKELIAHAIHRNSPRKNNPFIKINCAAIPENLMESELFGYEKGAFTGAGTKKQGRFELAHKGTLFLDEVGELPKDMQVKLLRVIQEQKFERVGGLQTIKVDVRLLTATNRNLVQDVRDGHFREDLFYRLNVIPAHLPPLRERREDIPALTDYFIEKFNKKLDRAVKGMDDRVRTLFDLYEWPGNIRELENLVERIILLARGDTITFADLPSELKAAVETGLSVPSGTLKKPFKDFVKTHMEDIEKKMIVSTLEECNHNVTHAAQQLGLSRKGLQLKMMKYKLRKSD
ncbi:MAG: DNA-binding response regulator [Deltaproteobacteria bacterium HGW-Deltaproteobacteria-11]|nr:MAG: DNA-binding response regulator [Deltaproteobacteria bacterium HGW-Deltaproteobacteria-11]